MKAEIITIGDEILIGQIIDSNSAWMAQELNRLGVFVHQIATVSDELKHIVKALKEAGKRADIVLVTGGLGPTKDDVTKTACCKFFDCEMAFDKKTENQVRSYFEKRGMQLTETNRAQAMVPASCTTVKNELGTAPGMWFKKFVNGKEKYFVFMPGVPHEMKGLMSSEILPKIKRILRQSGEEQVILHETVLTSGIGESWLSDKIQDFENALPTHIKLAYLPSPGKVRLRFTGVGKNKTKLKKEMDNVLKLLDEIIHPYIYGFGDDLLEQSIGALLRSKKKKIAVAESCTGGYLSHAITSVPGSSDYFKGGIVCYHNEIKIRELQVPAKVINEKGAVSEEVVRLLAENIRLKFKTDIGLASSGVSGPGGGTDDKPVGTIWIAYADKKKTVSKMLQYNQDRLRNIELTTVALFNLLRRSLTE